MSVISMDRAHRHNVDIDPYYEDMDVSTSWEDEVAVVCDEVAALVLWEDEWERYDEDVVTLDQDSIDEANAFLVLS